jgi:ABC-2 type transport system permease protein
MTGRIARKEMTEMIRDGRFRWAAVIVFALLIAALAAGWKGYRDVRAQHESARSETRQHWLDQGKKNPHSAAHYGIYAFKPRMLLSLLDRGVDQYTGVAVWLEAHRQNEFKHRPAQDATAAQRMSELTAAAVLQILIPLLIILLSFSAFAGEREQGTLRQLLSIGVERRHLALGKAAGITAALSLLLVPAAILGSLALLLASDDGAIGVSLARVMIMSVGYLVYLGIFVAVSLAVSARARSARVALIALIAFWIINTMIAPRAVADIARRLYPTPSAFEFATRIQRDMENGIDGHNPSGQREEELKQRVMSQYGVRRIEDLPVSFAGISLQEGEEYGNLVFDKHYGELWSAFKRQERFSQIAGLVAPLLAARSLSMSMAGTDFEQHHSFAEAAERYRRRLVKMMNDDMTYNAGKADFSYLAEPELWSRMPDFSYEAPAAFDMLKDQIAGVAMLAFWFIAATAAALLSAVRMRVA